MRLASVEVELLLDDKDDSLRLTAVEELELLEFDERDVLLDDELLVLELLFVVELLELLLVVELELFDDDVVRLSQVELLLLETLTAVLLDELDDRVVDDDELVKLKLVELLDDDELLLVVELLELLLVVELELELDWETVELLLVDDELVKLWNVEDSELLLDELVFDDCDDWLLDVLLLVRECELDVDELLLDFED